MEVSENKPLRKQAGELLKRERTARGLTQRALADHLGVTTRSIQRWEATDSTVDLAELEVALRALGVKLELVTQEAVPRRICTEDDLRQLEQVMDPGDFAKVLITFKTGQRVDFPTRAFREACRQLGLPFRWVDLRHGGALAELQDGGGAEQVAKRLGHRGGGL